MLKRFQCLYHIYLYPATPCSLFVSLKGFSRAEAMKKWEEWVEGKGGGNETSSLGNRRVRWRGRAEEKPQKIESRGKGERQGRNARAGVGNERRCMEGKSGTGVPETFVFKFF